VGGVLRARVRDGAHPDLHVRLPGAVPPARRAAAAPLPARDGRADLSPHRARRGRLRVGARACARARNPGGEGLLLPRVRAAGRVGPDVHPRSVREPRRARLAGHQDARPIAAARAEAPRRRRRADGGGAALDALPHPAGAGAGLVKPPPFEYHAPQTVEEALELLAGGAQVLAGGQSLLQLMKFRAVRPSVLVDINGVAGLDAIEERDGELHVGALVRQQTLLEDETVARGWPLLREATKYVGYRATRHRGTVGGSLAFAAPWAELTAAAVALEARIEVRSASGERTLDARSFFLGPNRTALEPGELITGVRFPKSPPGAAFHEVSARYRDYAQVAAAA